MDLESLRQEILEKVKLYTREKESAKFPAKSKEYIVKYAWRMFDEREIAAAVNAVLDQNIAAAVQGRVFENNFSQFLGVRHGILVNSGSSANLLTVTALKSKMFGGTIKRETGELPILEDGCEAITPAVTFPTTLNALLLNRIVPVFVDVEPGTYNMNPDLVRKAISKKTRLIMIPHTLGNPNDMDAIMALAREHNLVVIEDSCDALGSEYRGKKMGTFGDMGTFSFYLSHHMSMGEGGAVVTNNAILKRIVTSLRDWGRDCWCEPYVSNTCGKRFGWQLGKLPLGYDHKYIFSNIGYNLKVTDVQAAIGIEQVKKLPDITEKRRKHFKKLYEGLAPFESFFILPKSVPHANPSWFAFPLTLKTEKFNLGSLRGFLEEKGIETRQLFGGNILYQPAYRDIIHRVEGTLTYSDDVMHNTLIFGVHPGLNDEKIEYIITQFNAFLKDK